MDIPVCVGVDTSGPGWCPWPGVRWQGAGPTPRFMKGRGVIFPRSIPSTITSIPRNGVPKTRDHSSDRFLEENRVGRPRRRIRRSRSEVEGSCMVTEGLLWIVGMRNRSQVQRPRRVGTPNVRGFFQSKDRKKVDHLTQINDIPGLCDIPRRGAAAKNALEGVRRRGRHRKCIAGGRWPPRPGNSD